MKKFASIFSIILIIAMSLAMLAGCGGNTAPESKAPESTAPASAAPESTEPVSNETDWPKQAITLVIPGKAGGDTDFSARAYSNLLSEALGVTVIVENMDTPTVAVEKIKNAGKDGYNFLIYHDGFNMNILNQQIDYGWDAFECVAVWENDQANLLVARTDTYPDLQSFIDACNANPGKKTICAQGGGMYECLSFYIMDSLKIDASVVDGGGGADRVAALLGGQVDTSMVNWGLVKDYVASGEFTVLGVMSEERLECCPDVLTFKEQGYDIVCGKPYYVMAPAGTDPAIVEKMNAALREIAYNNEGYKQSIWDAYGLTPYCLDVAESQKMAADQFELYEYIYKTYVNPDA